MSLVCESTPDGLQPIVEIEVQRRVVGEWESASRQQFRRWIDVYERNSHKAGRSW
jgi:hypothetical protein